MGGDSWHLVCGRGAHIHVPSVHLGMAQFLVYSRGGSSRLTFWWIAAVVITLTDIPSFCPARNPSPWITDVIRAITTRAYVTTCRERSHDSLE